MWQEFAFASDIDEPGKSDLGDDSAELAARCANAVCGRPVSSREDFTGDDECRCVGSKVLEEVRHTVLYLL